MEWSVVAVYVLVGAVIGFIIARLTTPNNNQPDVKEELDKTKSELNQQRQDLVEHFSNSAELLENIYRDYNKLCQIMAKTSKELLPEESEKNNPFSNRLSRTLDTETKETVELQEAPRDYSENSSGLLKNESTEPVKQEKEEQITAQPEKKEMVEKVE